MKAIIINSAPGVGKSTLLKNLEKELSNGFAIIDGDDLARTVPLVNSNEWLNLMQDNIEACAKNYTKYKIPIVIISFVFPTVERFQRLSKLLQNEGFTVYHLRLICKNEELIKRIKKRNTQRIISIEKAIELNQQITELISNETTDSTGKSLDEVTQIVKNIIENIKGKNE